MELSPKASITDIRRLIQHFDARSINLFKQCLLVEAGCENEKEWLYYAIKFISHSMKPESIAKLRDKAIQLAESQCGPNGSSTSGITQTTPSTTATTNTSPQCSLFKWVQQQYNDKLSGLPSDIIDHIGSYLNKRQSISIGYLNKQLYIESQKQSYLNKRWNDEALVLEYPLLDKFLWKESNPYSYSMPTKLAVESSSLKVFSSYWFRKMFSRLNEFECGNFDCFPYVPIELLFKRKNTSNNNTNYKNNKCNDINIHHGNTIDCLDLSLHLETNVFDTMNHITPLCNRFIKFSNDMKSKNKHIRNVNELCITGNGSMSKDFKNTTARKKCKELLLTFAPIADRLQLIDCALEINNKEMPKN